MARRIASHLFKRKIIGFLSVGLISAAIIFLTCRNKDSLILETRVEPLVCFTQNPAKPTTFGQSGQWHYGHKKYYLPSRLCDRKQKFITIYSDNVTAVIQKNIVGFEVTYKPLSALPKTHRISDESAYILGYNGLPFEMENFFHFTKQLYFPLYHLTKKFKTLHDKAKNIAFYPNFYGICHSGKLFYHDIDRYFYFLDILNVKNKLEISAYVDRPEPHEVCYRNAVFSSEIFLEYATEAIDYFKSKAGVRDDVCNDNVLVFLNRTVNRRILNIDELVDISESLGYETKVVAMEKLTFEEQAQLIHCTKVLVGVTGAGLQWAFFMKDNSGVVEIAWPKHHWPQFFTGDASYNSGERGIIRNLNFATVTDAECRTNPDALNKYFEELFYVKGPFTKEESAKIVKDPRNFRYWTDDVNSVGKLCDALVSPKAFKEALESLNNTH